MAETLRPIDYCGFLPGDDDPGPRPILHPLQAYRAIRDLGWKLETFCRQVCASTHPDESHEQVHGR